MKPEYVLRIRCVLFHYSRTDIFPAVPGFFIHHLTRSMPFYIFKRALWQVPPKSTIKWTSWKAFTMFRAILKGLPWWRKRFLFSLLSLISFPWKLLFLAFCCGELLILIHDGNLFKLGFKLIFVKNLSLFVSYSLPHSFLLYFVLKFKRHAQSHTNFTNPNWSISHKSARFRSQQCIFSPRLFCYTNECFFLVGSMYGLGYLEDTLGAFPGRKRLMLLESLISPSFDKSFADMTYSLGSDVKRDQSKGS